MAQNPIVTITMENGDVMKFELYPDIAPVSVHNFISLIQKHFYDGLIFHRVIEGFMLQGGDPEGTGCGGPGYSIKGEFSAKRRRKQFKTHRRRPFYGKEHESRLRRFPVLCYAQAFPSP